MDIISAAISHFEYGISHDIFKEPVTSYAKAAVSALRAQREQQPNAPLTLDELREIDKASEPVYFYIFRSDIDSGWQIIEQIADSKIIFRGRANIYVPIKGLGVSYNLYRQKPEEDKHENYT